MSALLPSSAVPHLPRPRSVPRPAHRSQSSIPQILDLSFFFSVEIKKIPPLPLFPEAAAGAGAGRRRPGESKPRRPFLPHPHAGTSPSPSGACAGSRCPCPGPSCAGNGVGEGEGGSGSDDLDLDPLEEGPDVPRRLWIGPSWRLPPLIRPRPGGSRPKGAAGLEGRPSGCSLEGAVAAEVAPLPTSWPVLRQREQPSWLGVRTTIAGVASSTSLPASPTAVTFWPRGAQ